MTDCRICWKLLFSLRKYWIKVGKGHYWRVCRRCYRKAIKKAKEEERRKTFVKIDAQYGFCHDCGSNNVLYYANKYKRWYKICYYCSIRRVDGFKVVDV